MDFTREPIIETVITPKEGCKLVIRSSKGVGQEEFFVDAVEVVSFGHSFFFRSIERPKAFLVPVSDYEVLEVREARMVLKNVGIDRSIKIGGGKEPAKVAKEPEIEKNETVDEEEVSESVATTEASSETKAEPSRLDRKRDRRRNYRRRRGREELTSKDNVENGQSDNEEENIIVEKEEVKAQESPVTSTPTPTPFVSTILPPPPTLISQTIAKYKENALFKGAFFNKEEKEAENIGEKIEEGKEADEKKEIAFPQDIDEDYIFEEDSFEKYGSSTFFEKEEESAFDPFAAINDEETLEESQDNETFETKAEEAKVQTDEVDQPEESQSLISYETQESSKSPEEIEDLKSSEIPLLEKQEVNAEQIEKETLSESTNSSQDVVEEPENKVEKEEEDSDSKTTNTHHPL